jgi:hypothetical protein
LKGGHGIYRSDLKNESSPISMGRKLLKTKKYKPIFKALGLEELRPEETSFSL